MEKAAIFIYLQSLTVSYNLSLCLSQKVYLMMSGVIVIIFMILHIHRKQVRWRNHIVNDVFNPQQFWIHAFYLWRSPTSLLIPVTYIVWRPNDHWQPNSHHPTPPRKIRWIICPRFRPQIPDDSTPMVDSLALEYSLSALLSEQEEEEILVDGSVVVLVVVVVVVEQVFALSARVDSTLIALAWNSKRRTSLVAAGVDADAW